LCTHFNLDCSFKILQAFIDFREHLNSMISYEKSTPFTTLTPLQPKKGCDKKDIDSSKVNSVHVKDFKHSITTNGSEPPR
jgi:hypothetical protein